MIKAILYLLQIHGEMVFGDPAILIQNMFGITPKPFNAIDVILRPPAHQGFRMRHGMMVAIA